MSRLGYKKVFVRVRSKGKVDGKEILCDGSQFMINFSSSSFSYVSMITHVIDGNDDDDDSSSSSLIKQCIFKGSGNVHRVGYESRRITNECSSVYQFSIDISRTEFENDGVSMLKPLFRFYKGFYVGV